MLAFTTPRLLYQCDGELSCKPCNTKEKKERKHMRIRMHSNLLSNDCGGWRNNLHAMQHFNHFFFRLAIISHAINFPLPQIIKYSVLFCIKQSNSSIFLLYSNNKLALVKFNANIIHTDRRKVSQSNLLPTFRRNLFQSQNP